jgi:ATP-dependent helicase HrpA
VNLKLIITSATIDTEKFSKAFDDAPVIEVSGRHVSGRGALFFSR